MSDHEAEADAVSFAREIAGRLIAVEGVAAVVLGGSRARGDAPPDADIDLGIYYHPARPLDLAALRALAAELDESGSGAGVTEPGAWGPWVNGGAWLTVRGCRVDWLYRDIEQVTSVVAAARAGTISADYYLGHPHAFHSYIYLGEVATCLPLADPGNVVAALKALVTPYPPALRRAIVARYGYEARFMLECARKPAARGDVFAAAGFLFRVAAALVQVVFALNETYFVNEKGALAATATMQRAPARFATTVRRVLGRPGSTPAQLQASVAAFETLVARTEALATEVPGR